MATPITIEPNKTYATKANAIKAVNKKFGDKVDGLRYFIMKTDEGRFFPVFFGHAAIDQAVFFHFNVIA